MTVAWLQLAFLLLLAGVGAGVAIAVVVVPRILPRLRPVAPAYRFGYLAALAALPAMAGALALGIAFVPSLLDAVGLISDHCTRHLGHTFHLCFLHHQPPPASALFVGAAGLLILWAGVGVGREAAGLVRAHRYRKMLAQVGRYDPALGGWVVVSERPLALSIGVLWPRLFISEGARDLLAGEQLRAVIAHEQAHARRRDALLKLVLRLLASLHLPTPRAALLRELDLACEQACDEWAARATGDRLAVSEAILAMRRARVPTPPLAGVLGFGPHALELRVRAMLDGRWNTPRWRTAVASLVAVVLTAFSFYEALHHAAETLVALVF